MVALAPALLLLLAVAGAGEVPGALPVLAVTALAAATLARPLPHGRFSWPLFLCGPAILLLTCVTLLPLPGAMVGTRRASAFAAVERLEERLVEAGLPPAEGGAADTSLETGAASAPPPAPLHPRLSLSSSGSVRFLFLAAAGWGSFLLGACVPPARRRNLLLLLVLAGSAVALCGILGRYVFPQGKTLLWMIPALHGRPLGPFVNRNHFALFCALLVPAAMALSVSPRLSSESAPATASAWLGDQMVRAVAAGCLFVLVAAVLVSLSRGGFLALLAGLIVSALAWVGTRPLKAALAGLLVAVSIGVVLWWPQAELHDRLDTLQDAAETPSAKTRFQVWGDGVRIWREFPVFGCGMHAFRVVYPLYKSSASRKGAIHAENEYVQTLAEGGVAAAALAVAAVSVYAACLLASRPRRTRRGRTGRDAHDPPWPPESTPATGGEIRIAAGVAAVIAVHAVVDFGLRIPLNLYVAALLLGLALDWRRPDAAPHDGDDRRRRPSPVCATLLLALLVTGWLAVWRGRSSGEMTRYKSLQEADLGTLVEAARSSPTYWIVWYETGRRCLEAARLKDQPPERLVARQALGLDCLRRAADCNPSDYRLWRELAPIEQAAGNPDQAREAARRVLALRPYLSREMTPYLEPAAGRGPAPAN